MGVSGCPRSCVESGVKDFGVLSQLKMDSKSISVVMVVQKSKAEFLTTVETEDEVIKLCGALMQYYRETGIYAERTAPWLRRLGFENVKESLLDPERQNELFERIMDAKKAVEAEPWEAITSNAQARKIFDKWRRCNTWKQKKKLKATTIDELAPQIGKRLLSKAKR